MAKRRTKMNASKESKDLVPHPGELRKHFTPSSVEQSGLGVAFFAVVAAIIILLLLSIWGGYHLTGFATGPNARTAIVTFIPYNNYPISTGGYTGNVDAVRIGVSNPAASTLTLKFLYHYPDSLIRNSHFLVVTRRRSATSLPVGSVLHATAAGWVLDRVGGLPQLLYGYYTFDYLYFPLFVTSTAYPDSGYNYPLKVYVSLTRNTQPYPRDVYIQLTETVITNIVSNESGTSYQTPLPGIWTATWENNAPLEFSGVSYRLNYYGLITPASPGFVSPFQSVLNRADGTVSIAYSYDNRLCTQPSLPGGSLCTFVENG